MVGYGLAIAIWSRPLVPWLESVVPRVAFNPATPNLIAHLLNFQKMFELFLPSTRLWKTNLLARLFDPSSASIIRRIKPLPFPEKDTVVWRGSKTSSFDVKTYRMIIEDWVGLPNTILGSIWKLKIHERLKLLLWRLGSDMLPVRNRLARLFPCHRWTASFVVNTQKLFVTCSVDVSWHAYYGSRVLGESKLTPSIS